MQSYASHRRYFPPFHFFVLPLLFINLIVRIVVAVRRGGGLAWWDVAIAFVLVVFAFAARYMILRVQDRVIALDESLRLMRCLPEDLRARVGELRTRHLVALRFCDEAEVADLTRAVLAGEANTAGEIKKRIRKWRPDVRPRA
jgi:Family of unknown function (DUF6526)